MKWINFLHLYQPANTDALTIEEATEKSYKRIIRAIKENKNIKFTLNIQGCLFLRWEELGYIDLINDIAELVSDERIELTSSASDHALLPLITEEETKLQILENERILKLYIGEYYKPKGFFFPEMAYNSKVGKIVKEMGYEWIVLDEIAKNGKLNTNNFHKKYVDKETDLKVIFRSRKDSLSFVPNIIKDQETSDKELCITATDGELYGLRHIDHTGVFENLLKDTKLETKTIEEFIKEDRPEEKINLFDCSWESTEEELKDGQPFILWSDRKNKIHKLLWQFAHHTIKTINSRKEDHNYKWARWHMVRGLASCTFWWAAARDFKLFSAISWSPDQIERGINEMIRAIRSLESEDTRELKIEAEKMYIKLKHDIWTKHWEYYWKKK